MIIAAHQPHYLPWLGYLDKLAKADVFVVMDDLPLEAPGFHHRQRVKLPDGAAWLTVPVEHDHRIDNSGSAQQHWQRRSWLTLETNYRRAPHWQHYCDELREVYVGRTWTSLVELDLHMLGLARRWLGIETEVIRASQLGLCGAKTDRIVELCRRLGARSYLSGCGGSTALDVERLGRAGFGVIRQSFQHPVYSQRYPERGFDANLGFLDLVLNCGPASRDILFPASHPIHVAPARSDEAIAAIAA
jgi:hypothetical protein